MTVARPLAITPLTDLTTWLRGRGLETGGETLIAGACAWLGGS